MNTADIGGALISGGAAYVSGQVTEFANPCYGPTTTSPPGARIQAAES
jgi:hypothetical protein